MLSYLVPFILVMTFTTLNRNAYAQGECTPEQISYFESHMNEGFDGSRAEILFRNLKADAIPNADEGYACSDSAICFAVDAGGHGFKYECVLSQGKRDLDY